LEQKDYAFLPAFVPLSVAIFSVS